MPITGEIQIDITRDVLSTLYGLNPEQESRDGLFDHRCEIQLGFVDDSNKDELYLLDLNLPFGRVLCYEADWQALLVRIAAKLGAQYRVASYQEIINYQRMEQMIEMLKQIPKENMGSA